MAATNKTKNFVSVEIDKSLSRWSIEKSGLLLYVAEMVIHAINERTDSGISADGSPFRPYAKDHHAWAIDPETGEYLHDAHGWRIEYVRDDPRYTPTLRSLEDVKEDRRMRHWLRTSPKNPAITATSVTVVQSGGRKRPDGVHLSHAARAMRCVETGRRHIAVTDAEIATIMAEIRDENVVAFLAGVAAAKQQRAKERLRRSVSRALAKSRRAEAKALREHEKAIRAAAKQQRAKE